MSKQGIVIAIDDEMATVAISENTKCDTCIKRSKVGACDTCPDRTEKESKRVLAHNKIGAETGDKVELGHAPGESVMFIVFVFVLPIIAAVMSYFICVLFTDDNGIMSKVAITVFVIATAFSCFYSYKRSKHHCDYSIKRVI